MGFPHGTLYRREYAAFVLSEALGWQIVPPTVIREKGPHGIGTMQLYMHHDRKDADYFALRERHTSRSETHGRVRFDCQQHGPQSRALLAR